MISFGLKKDNPGFATGIDVFRICGIKNLQTYKPDSVGGYHLSVPQLALRNQSAYPSSRLLRIRAGSNGPFSSDDIHGISAP
jgi:hypothetical protein